jgi:two-component sensor histidine kinase
MAVVTGLALVFHEFVANAANCGALSMPSGRVEIGFAIEADQIRLDWLERGGPPIAAAPETHGFRTWLADGTITGQWKATRPGGGATMGWRSGSRCRSPNSCPRRRRGAKPRW